MVLIVNLDQSNDCFAFKVKVQNDYGFLSMQGQTNHSRNLVTNWTTARGSYRAIILQNNQYHSKTAKMVAEVNLTT